MHKLTTTTKKAALGALLFLVACGYKVPKEATASGQEMFQLCAECHGETGQGHREYNAPAIAGLPVWYIEAQLGKFKSGARGAHPADVAGLMMRPMTRSFHNDNDLKAVAAYVAKLPRNAPAPVLAGGDPKAGQQVFAGICTTCHQADGSGQDPNADPNNKTNKKGNAPPLKNASDWYLFAQLQKFKAGVRGKSPKDLDGALMSPMAQTLKDEQAMKDVVAYITTLK